MLATLRQVFAPPIFEGDAEKSRIAALLNTILLIIMGLNVILNPILILVLANPVPSLIVDGVLTAIQIGLWFLMRRGQVHLASILFCTTLWVYIIVVSLTFGGFDSLLPISYTILVFMAGVLLRRSEVYAFSALSLLGIAVQVYFEINQKLPPSLVPLTPIYKGLVMSSFLVVAMALLSLALRNITNALNQARCEIAERQQAEQALRANDAQLRRLTDNMLDMISELDSDMTIKYVSPSIERLLAYRPTDMLGRNALELVHPADLPQMIPTIQAAFTTNVLAAMAYRYRHADGHYVWLESVGKPLSDQAGAVTGAVLGTRDITKRKQAEESVMIQLQRLTALRAIDVAITGGHDLQMVLNIVLEQVTIQLGMDAACMLLLNSHTQTINYAARHGFYTDALRHTRMRLGEEHAGRAALERHFIHIPDLRERKTDSLFSSDVLAEGFVAYYAVPLITKGSVMGVLEVFHRTIHEADNEWLAFLETLAGQAAIAVDNARLLEGLQRANIDLALAYDATIEGWSRAMDLRDKETEGHTQRVTELTELLVRAMGIGDAELVHMRRGALLHDIGKMGVPDSILFKPGPLTDQEREIIHQHPQYAFAMISPIAYLHPALDIPYCHHEKWDGTGYPRGLKGEQIPLAARLFAVVDVWDALCSDRPYRPAWPRLDVLEHIRSLAGTHFDPMVVELFLRVMNEQTEE